MTTLRGRWLTAPDGPSALPLAKARGVLPPGTARRGRRLIETCRGTAPRPRNVVVAPADGGQPTCGEDTPWERSRRGRTPSSPSTSASRRTAPAPSTRAVRSCSTGRSPTGRPTWTARSPRRAPGPGSSSTRSATSARSSSRGRGPRATRSPTFRGSR